MLESPVEYIDPTEQTSLDAFPKESYLNRVRWIWSRKPHQIIINNNVQKYIVHLSKRLNSKYDSHIKLFGAEAWKKLSRVSIAVAAMLCSMDDTGENLIVKKDHVHWASWFMAQCYDNSLFKLGQYVENERKYTKCDAHAVQALQGIYNQHATLVNQMEMATELSQSQLRSISGLDNADFNKVVNQMAECHFFRWNGDKIVPSERFRTALAQISRNTYLKGVGQNG